MVSLQQINRFMHNKLGTQKRAAYDTLYERIFSGYTQLKNITAVID